MYKPHETESKDRFVPQSEDGSGEFIAAGTALGAFAGYLRRPKPSGQGLTAQMFGENGPDADTICALHLTRFQDCLVKVSVWGLKDKDGRRMRGEDGSNPLLAEFIATVKRPAPSMHGQTALFFGENGPNSDAISVFNQTRYLDSLVYVEITKADPGQIPADIKASTPEKALTEYANRLTPAEQQAIKQQQRKAAEAIKLLRVAQFFQSESIWSLLGTQQNYTQWIEHQACCHPGNVTCDNSPVEAYKIPGGRSYQVVPLCREHAALWDRGEGTAGAQKPLAFLQTRHLSLIQRWAEERLREVLKVPKGYDPTPSAIYDWAIERRVTQMIPHSFNALL